MGNPGTRYSEEFKREAVSLILDRDYSVAEVSRRLGVTTFSLYKWLKADPRNPDSDSAREKDRDLEAENRQLKAELRRVQEERDILRKAWS